MNPSYRSFLLRLWQAGTPEKPAWHASLEDPRTRLAIGFDDLELLCEYLRSLTSKSSHIPEVPEQGSL